MWSVSRLYDESLLVAGADWRIGTGELGRVLESYQYKVIKEEMARRLHSDLK
jgi:hypothetical protein